MTAQMFSQTGDQLLGVALALYVLDASGSPSLSAATALARVVPAALLGAIGGAVVDRTNRRRLLVRLSLARAVLVLPLLLVASGTLPLFAVLALELVRATVAQLTGPAAGASLPVVVAADDLPQANARLAARTVVLQLAAPTLGAVLYARYGLELAIALNAAAYLAASVAWSRLPAQAALPRGEHRLLSSTRAGYRLVRNDAVLLPLLVSLTVALVGLTLELAILVPLIRQELQGSASSVGMLTSLQAVGALLAAWVFTRLYRRLGVAPLIRIGMCGLPVATIAFLLSQEAHHAIPGVVAAGFLLSTLTASAQVYLQRSVAPSHLGRVLGIIGSTMALAAVVGTTAAIAATVALGLRGALVVALAIELAGLVLYLVRPPRFADEMRPAAPAGRSPARNTVGRGPDRSMS
jgi:MFS family permease